MIYKKPKIQKVKKVLVTYFQDFESLKNEIKKGNDLEINSAFKARFKHLDLLLKQDPNNQIRYTNHIADFYIKTVRNKLLLGQSNWFLYYKYAIYYKYKTHSFLSIFNVSVGIILLKFFGKGYSFFK
jgi:hypothetical protein